MGPLPTMSDSLSNNWPWILLTLALSVAVVAVLWIVLSRWVEAFLRWLDSILPGDFSALHVPVARAAVLMASAAVLSGAGIFIATSLGMDTSGAVAEIREWGTNAGKWLLARAARILIIVGIGYALVRLIKRVTPPMVRRYLSSRAGEGVDQGEIDKRTRTLEGVIRKTATLLIVLIVLFVVLDQLGVNIAPLLAGAGVAGIAIGFGAQNLIRDILSGMFIIMEDQYRVGDVVNVAGIGGLVEDINLRRTVLRDLNFVVHSVPNGEIRVSSNMTREKSRAVVDIGVAYKEDLDRVIAVLNRVGQEMYDDPQFGPLMNGPLKVLRVDGFLDSAISIRVMGETKPIQQWTVMGEFRRRVKKTFDKEGIEIPFPHRTIYWGTNVETVIRRSSSKSKGTQNGGQTNSRSEGADDGDTHRV